MLRRVEGDRAGAAQLMSGFELAQIWPTVPDSEPFA